MTRQEIIEASEACLANSCQACPLFTKWNENCHQQLLEAIKALAADREIKCSDPKVLHEYGRGHVLQVTLQDDGREAAQELAKAYVGGYLKLTVQTYERG